MKNLSILTFLFAFAIGSLLVQKANAQNKLELAPSVQLTTPNLSNSNTPQASKEKDEFLPDSVVKQAIKYIGKPYKPKGKNPLGFDCPGFTQFVMSQYGIMLPDLCIQQAAIGKKVDIEQAQKGDLIFFKGSDLRNVNAIEHVGIVVSDPGEMLRFIIASTSKGVVCIDNIENHYFRPRYAMVKRLVL